ncbi:mycothiol synthase [Gryllotalpicola ginsengisoli]|uniref:mycothiol synthase n=1 Tax=Gryllotalpicola ginsengisoli TaxID=444608 RepID=UPI0003B55648|nr:mycothiol synthase [Gryllotalpicola ginsengisoli]
MTARVRLVATDASAAGPLVAPFDEQTRFDVARGARRLFAVRRTPEDDVVGSAVLGGGELDLHIAPEFRTRGFGADAAQHLLERAGDGRLTAWSHGDHPAARSLARRFGFRAVRTLLELELVFADPPADRAAPASGTPAVAPEAAPGEVTIDAFRPGADEDGWLALNARVFARHPEQGRLTRADLDQRMAEPWFDPADFLVARDADGTMIGFNWLKVEPGGTEGEIYVIGVAPEAAGRGLGRKLMNRGLQRLRERGCTSAELYVEGDNAAAVHLYRSLGFTDRAVHVQYERAPA